jgi:hypothetical protein
MSAMGRELPFAAGTPERQVSGTHPGSAHVRKGSLPATGVISPEAPRKTPSPDVRMTRAVLLQASVPHESDAGARSMIHVRHDRARRRRRQGSMQPRWRADAVHQKGGASPIGGDAGEAGEGRGGGAWRSRSVIAIQASCTCATVPEVSTSGSLHEPLRRREANRAAGIAETAGNAAPRGSATGLEKAAPATHLRAPRRTTWVPTMPSCATPTRAP